MPDSTETTPIDSPIPPEPKPESPVKTPVDEILEVIRGQAANTSETLRLAQADQQAIAAIKAELQAQQNALNDVVTSAREKGATVPGIINDVIAAQGQVSEIKAQVAATGTTAQEKLNEVTATFTKLTAVATEAEQHGVTIAQKSAHIEESLKHAQSVHANIDQLQTAAQNTKSKIDGLLKTSTTQGGAVTTVLSEAQTSKANIDALGQQVETLRATAEGHTATTRKLAEKSDVVESRVLEYEKQIALLITEQEELKKQIESLLPGATSAGLASAFGARRKGFIKPQWFWDIAFFASVGALIVIAGFEFAASAGTAPSLTTIGLSLLHRLPLALPLIWLAIYSSRQAALHKRLEEDYGYKEVVSRSFEGFRKQMKDLGDSVNPGSPLGRLCNNTLSEIAKPPQRIYDANRPDVSPATALADSAGPIAAPITKLIPGTKEQD